MRSRSMRRRLAGSASRPPVLAVTACSSSPAARPPAAAVRPLVAPIPIWDPYPQFDNSSAWVKLLDQCGTSAGVTVKRTAYDTTDLTNKALLAAQQDAAPDVLIVDNPVVSTLASSRCPDHDRRHEDRHLGVPAEPDRRRPGRRQDLRRADRREHPRALLQQGDPDRCRCRPVDDHQLGHAHRGAGEGQGNRQDRYHLLRHRYRGGQLPVPAMVLGVRGESDEARLGAGRCRAEPVDHVAPGRLRTELGHQRYPDDELAGVRGREDRVRRERYLAAVQREVGRLRLRHHRDSRARPAAPRPHRPAASS